MNHPRYYILEGTTLVAVQDALEWAYWFETAERRVALTILADGIEVSTVFLGLDHNFCGTGPPVLFETMVFQPAPHEKWPTMLDDYTARYCTWHEAEQGHEAVCAQVQADLQRLGKP